MLKTLTIVVVDDDEAILEPVAEYIRKLGHHVITHTHAIDALDTLCEQRCDLLLADAQLNGLDGLELARMARKQEPTIAIVIMTGYEEMYPLTAALSAGADAYMTKPFNLKTLGLMFERSYWETLSRLDWWEGRTDEARGEGDS